MMWTAGVHHDGSALYVSNPLPRLKEKVRIRLRTPLDAPIRSVFLRSAPDGEAHLEKMEIVERDSVSAFWAADLRVTMPSNPYRFHIFTDSAVYFLNGLGISGAELPDAWDFKLLADYTAPRWVQEVVFYQIFVDRFHNGDSSNNVPPHAWTKRGFATQQRDWGSVPLSWKEGGSLDFYGGDLLGIVQKLGYLRDLGVNGLYLTPIFPAQTNHRYDITDFDHVDPYLGGDDGLAALRAALDAAGMRLMLDITPNHVSWQHPWFTAAQADDNAPTSEYFTFYDKHRRRYEDWLGVPSLVKLNYSGQAIREVMYRAPDLALRRWLREPYRVDGWRLDVHNMLAQQGTMQLGAEITREMRAAVKADNPNLYLIGEHFFDGAPNLQGDQLDAAMNYAGFHFPLRRWLSGYKRGAAGVRLPSEGLAEQMRAYLAAIPWAIAAQQFNLLGSHDTSRIKTALKGDARLLELGVTLLMTYVGVPCVYYGDEIGLEGGDDPDNRRCMIWDESAWDADLRAHYQRLIRLRRDSSALREGGFQWLFAEDDVIAFQRHSADQRLIVVGNRGAADLVDFTLPVWHSGLADGAILQDVFSEKQYPVQGGSIQLDHLRAACILVET